MLAWPQLDYDDLFHTYHYHCFCAAPAQAPCPSLHVCLTVLTLHAAPEPVVVAFNSVVPLICGGLLVGDTSAATQWPSKLRPVPSELEPVVESLSVSLQVRAGSDGYRPCRGARGGGKAGTARLQP
jgi:hypothetical protein